MSLLKDLMAIGFTEYEAKVYVALLGEHPTTGYQISKQAGVPRSMVYEALGRLDVRGAVLKSDDRRVTLYRPVPPEVLLDRFEQEHLDRINNLRKELKGLYAGQEGDYLWSIRGYHSVQAFSVQLIERAKKELMLVLPDSALEDLRKEIQAACNRGVQVSALLTGYGQLDCGEVAHHPPLESELQELTHTLVVVADDQECLIASTNGEVSATVTTNPNLVLIARQFVWMELFTQRIYKHLGTEILDNLEVEDRRIFESFSDIGRA